MSTESTPAEQKEPRPKIVYKSGTSEAVYGLGLLGAWVYYLSHAASFGMGVLGILKGVFWPAILVYEMLKYLTV